ncbi:hypothetical protein DNU06_07990 [Putridiphycobacter roseus]|uniref:Anti-sigma factor n=1 Tax=Putridiphycobacter roseus TaxID=2219161 RepID=A0A2W1N0F3_9FLAO|nr:anti-sigma factor [Putridiphycobacter roseus]PZE17204.1 hypothetical protein DNU06_07990 [Putridiphycobacter roseus]
MKKSKITLLAILSIGLVFTSCKKNKSVDLALNINGLENLGSTAKYEGWIIVDGDAISTGVFEVNDAGEMSTTTFEVNQKDLEDASTFVLTIEPANDTDPKPSAIHILGGEFSGENATLTIGHEAAIGNDFTTSNGAYLLATPTDGAMNNENSGVWFIDNRSGSAVAGLDLPTLPAGWNYEGWAVINGTPVSTGTFLSATGADASAPFSSTLASAPAFPGEDFLINAPSGLTFPTDLAGKTIVVSVEPSPDNSANPFLLKPLVATVSTTAVNNTAYDMSNNAANTNPTGTATR